ncbi:putative metal-dependent hydrolase [Corynebacterium mustelae]|uniref:Putative metal-dependent hydrolase n=1 Tax=Corynebacterium mustelae TaxID=571915 RepID=A0A0G3GVC7_9CORY|nr:cyclase family protein [Corynebacterium mustelae]AKK04485.1 putative metal-dependent hydrolase [Corynebacterium mustelae]
MTDLWQLAHTLRTEHTFVDLTHAFQSGQPRFHLLPDEERTTLFNVPEHGFEVTQYSFVGQWGTHVDPPVHFVAGARTLDNIDVKQMILPLVVLDFTAQVAADADFTPEIADIKRWEADHGTIPAGAFVAFRSDWSKRWPDPELVANKDADGIAHYPGWNPEVVEWLITKRDITAIGHETTDTDQGIVVSGGTLPAELLLLQHDKWQIELLANLDQVPATGALIVATWPKPLNGTGFPARAFAIV